MEPRSLRPEAKVGNINTPVKRKRKPLKSRPIAKRKVAEIKMASRNRRKELDKAAKAYDAEQREKAGETQAKAAVASGEIKYLGTKGGEDYAQRRHAETLAKTLELEDTSILETEDGFVVAVPLSDVPDGHEPVAAPKFTAAEG